MNNNDLNKMVYNLILQDILGVDSSNKHSSHNGGVLQSKVGALENKINKALDGIYEYLTDFNKEMGKWKNNLLLGQKKQIESYIVNYLEYNNQKGSDEYSTKVRTWTDKTVDNDIFRIGATGGTGRINQLLLIADDNTYNINIMIDDNILYDKSYSYFYDNSQYIDSLSAFLNGGYYYFSIRNLNFKKSLNISVTTTTSTVFSEVNLRYTIRDEKIL